MKRTQKTSDFPPSDEPKAHENHEPKPAPDGGLQAWTQVFCMHLTFFNSWGMSNSFGVFQQFYSETLPQTPSDISWIGGVQVALLFFVGIFVGRLTDAGYFRHVFVLGVLLQLVGVFMMSLCKTYWQIMLAQAVCMGLGNGCTFCSGLPVMSSYLSRNRALAVGIAAAGAAVGGLIYPVVGDRLLYQDAIGFPWTARVMGFVMLATQISCIFARDQIGISNSLNLTMVLNGVGIVGRILPGVIGDRVTGMLNILIPLSFAANLLVYCWAAISTAAGPYVFAVVYGIIAAALQSLFPATATTMTPSIERTGTQLGMILTIVGVASLTGPAIEGVFIQGDDGVHLYAQLFSATAILIGALAAVACRIAKTGFKLKVKA